MPLAHNIYKLYIIKFAKWFMLYMPIIGLFYADNGLTDIDLFTIQAAFSLTSALFEIPSGYFADVVGRKKTLIIGSFMGAIGFIIYSFGNDFWAFLIAEIIMGIGQSFISGTDSAMLYDSLKHSQQKEKYLKYEGRLTSLGGFAETIAALLGGTIAGIFNLQAVFVVQIFIASLAIPAAIMLREPARTKLQHTSLKQIADISWFALFKHKALSRTTLLSSVIGIATLTMAWTMQSFFVHQHFSESITTTIWVILNVTVATISLFASQIISKFGIKNLVLSMILIIPLGFIALGSFPLWIVFAILFVFHIVRGYATPILKDLIQAHCDSTIRATVMSVRGMVIRIGFSIVGPSIGYFSGRYSFDFAVIAAGSLFFITSTVGYIMYRKIILK